MTQSTDHGSSSIPPSQHANSRWNRTNSILEDKELIAVSFERFTNKMYFGGQGWGQQAVICGQSGVPDASFTFETGYLLPDLQEEIGKLGSHGFTVVELPSNWRYGFRSSIDWQNEVIKQAVNKASVLPESKRITRTGYDLELADSVMQALDESFPQVVSIMELKYQYHEEPSDDDLSTALSALIGDGFVKGALHGNGAKLNPLEQLSLTKEGRRYISDMKSKTAKSNSRYRVNDASQFILEQLLNEFRDRHLTTADLHEGYEGLRVQELKEAAIGKGINEVDFDLGLSDLEEHQLVKTGPMDVAGGAAYRDVYFMPTIYSKREYSYLSKEGYKEATEQSLSAKPSTATRIHISGSTFHNSPIGVGDGFAQTVVSQANSAVEMLSAFRSEVKKLIEDESKQREILLRLDELESSGDKSTLLQRYNNLVATIGNHITVFSPLLVPLFEKLMR